MTLTRSAIVLVFCLVAAISQAAAAPALLTWLAEDSRPGPVVTFLDETVGDAGSPTKLSATPWRARVPRIDVPLLDGRLFPLGDDAQRVLVLSFWASWCPPCIEELPQIEALAVAREDRALDVLTVNMRESIYTATQFVEAMGLGLPVGEYVDELDRAMRIETLPTLIVADRQGRIRARWEGRHPGFERDLRELVDGLLEGRLDEPELVLAEAYVGGESVRTMWSREAPGLIEGLHSSAPPGDLDGPTPVLFVVAGRSFLAYGAEGEVLKRTLAPRGSGVLRAGDVVGGDRNELLSFRPGGTRLVRLDAEGGHRSLDAPAPLFDAAVMPPAAPGAESRIVVATVEGLAVGPTNGDALEPVDEEATAFRQVDVLHDPGETALLALDFEGRTIRFDASLSRIETRSETGGAQSLVIGARLLGAAGVPEGAVAVGRAGEGGATWVGLVTGSGWLRVFDADRRDRELLRAHWPGASSIVAADLDGDGFDELVVASGNRLTALKLIPDPPGADRVLP